MTDGELLDDTLKRLGAVRVGCELRASCPLCQPDEEAAGRFKLLVNPGGAVPVVFYCVVCGVPGDRDHNRTVWESVCTERGLDREFLTGRRPPEEIDRLWSTVAVAFAHADLPPAADPDTLHEVYSELLDRLELTDSHARWLARRGLDPEIAFGLGYRSTPADPGSVAEALRSEFGELLDGVPGFTVKGLHTRTQAVLHPCRDGAGRVVAIKQRLLDGKKARMRLLSSAPFGGPRALSVCHCPLGVGSGNWPRLWITEGERKADFNFYRREHPTVAVPGVSQWQSVFVLLDQLRPPEVVLAFDRDRAGDRCREQVGPVLAGRGYRVLAASWESGKGLDDTERVTVTDWSGPEGAQRPRTTTALTPNTRPDQGKRLRDWEIVPFLRERGPILRDQLNAYGPTVTRLIKSGEISMTRTPQGQLLQVKGL